MAQLVGAREIASRLGLVRVQAVHYLRRADPSFPQPVYWGRGRRGGVWYWPDVWRWWRGSQRPEAGAALPPKPVLRGRRVDVGAQEIVDRLGLRHVQRVHALRTGDRFFPPPVFGSPDGQFANRLWSWPDVWAWAHSSRRRFAVELGASPDLPGD